MTVNERNLEDPIVTSKKPGFVAWHLLLLLSTRQRNEKQFMFFFQIRLHSKPSHGTFFI